MKDETTPYPGRPKVTHTACPWFKLNLMMVPEGPGVTGLFTCFSSPCGHIEQSLLSLPFPVTCLLIGGLRESGSQPVSAARAQV